MHVNVYIESLVDFKRQKEHKILYINIYILYKLYIYI